MPHEMFIVSNEPLTLEGGVNIEDVAGSLKQAKDWAKEELLNHYDGDNCGRYIYKLVPVLKVYR